MDSIKEMIEKRAYHLFLKRGGLHGYSVQDWFQEEKEIFSELDAKKKAEAPAAVKPAKAETPAPTRASPVASTAPAASAVKPATVQKPAAKPSKKGK
jgi:hypothetical protein